MARTLNEIKYKYRIHLWVVLQGLVKLKIVTRHHNKIFSFSSSSTALRSPKASRSLWLFRKPSSFVIIENWWILQSSSMVEKSRCFNVLIHSIDLAIKIEKDGCVGNGCSSWVVVLYNQTWSIMILRPFIDWDWFSLNALHVLFLLNSFEWMDWIWMLE